jgi:hypothetical protein
MLFALKPGDYEGLSKDGAARRMLEVCRIAAANGQTMLAADHLDALAKVVRSHGRQALCSDPRALPWPKTKGHEALHEFWPDPASPFRLLSVRAAHALYHSNLTTADAVAAMPDAVLQAIPNCGKGTFAEIRSVFPAT